MTKKIGEIIDNIMKENETNKILILTNHLQIFGEISNYSKDCKNCSESLVSLERAKIAPIEKLCNCSENGCENVSFTEFDWFNVNVDEIVGFSILK